MPANLIRQKDNTITVQFTIELTGQMLNILGKTVRAEASIGETGGAMVASGAPGGFAELRLAGYPPTDYLREPYLFTL